MTFDSFEEHAYLGQPVELYHIDIDGGADYYYTSADIAQTYLSNTYQVQPGLSRSSIKMTGDGKGNEIGVTLPHDHDVPVLFKTSLPHAEIFLTIYKRHRADSNFQQVFSGAIIGCQFSFPTARLACVPIDGQRDEPILQPTWQHRCNWKIYDGNCGLDFGVWAVTKTVTAISSDGKTLTLGDLSAGGADYFKGGVVRLGTEAHMTIESHTHSGSGDTCTMLAAMGGLVVGDTVKVAPSCQGSRLKCHSTFGNRNNNMSFKVPVRNIFTGDGLKGTY